MDQGIVLYCIECLIRELESVARCYNDIGSSPELVDVIIELAKSTGGGHVDTHEQSDT